MQRKGFTLLELLIVMSIIILMMSILLPCLMTAKDRALELLAMETEVNEEGKVHLEIHELNDRKLSEDIYIIKINPPGNRRVFIKKPYPSGMKLIDRDGQDYIKWRPKVSQIGVHFITVVSEGEETYEQKITIYVFNKELLEAEQEGKSETDKH